MSQLVDDINPDQSWNKDRQKQLPYDRLEACHDLRPIVDGCDITVAHRGQSGEAEIKNLIAV